MNIVMFLIISPFSDLHNPRFEEIRLGKVED